MKDNLDRNQKAMIFTLNVLSKSKIEGIDNKVINEKGKEVLKNFQPTAEEIERCLQILMKKGYLYENHGRN